MVNTPKPSVRFYLKHTPPSKRGVKTAKPYILMVVGFAGKRLSINIGTLSDEWLKGQSLTDIFRFLNSKGQIDSKPTEIPLEISTPLQNVSNFFDNTTTVAYAVIGSLIRANKWFTAKPSEFLLLQRIGSSCLAQKGQGALMELTFSGTLTEIAKSIDAKNWER